MKQRYTGPRHQKEKPQGSLAGAIMMILQVITTIITIWQAISRP